MIAFYVIVVSLGILFAICAGLVAVIFRLRRTLVENEHRLQHNLQNLRYELNTKLYPLEEKFYAQAVGIERIIYDGRNTVKASDFAGNGAQAWDYVAHRFTDDSGEGSYQITDNVITINRTNTAGRYELYLKRFVFEGEEHNSLPASATQNVRRLRLTCEVKKESVSHILRFVFKGETSKDVLDEKDYVIFSPEWEKVELFFSVSTKEPSLFRIDDLSVLKAPSSVSIRNLVLVEKN